MADDVVAELDAHIHDASNSVDYVIEWRRTLLIGLLQRARDEIVALRETKVLPGWTDALRQTRAQALEEAALECEARFCDGCADAIRALKGKRQ